MSDDASATGSQPLRGHSLFVSGLEVPAAVGQRDNLLTSPVEESEFEGSPYPRPGVRVWGTGGNPPWLVVDHYVDQVLMPRWPVRLWRVGDLEEVAEEDQISGSCTRVVSVEIIEELPAWIVFGPRGFDVARIIEAADRLSEESVELLAASREENAGRIYKAAWDRWRAQGKGNSGSPVGNGLILIHHAVQRSAERAGPQLFCYDPENGVDVLADAKWIAAESACLEAGLALGAPHLVAEPDQAMLTQAWRQWAVDL